MSNSLIILILLISITVALLLTLRTRVFGQDNVSYSLKENETGERKPKVYPPIKHEEYYETGEIKMTLINDYEELKNTDEENLDSQIEVKVSGAPKEIRNQINFENFKPGSVFQGKKEMKTVKGGRVIIETDFTLK